MGVRRHPLTGLRSRLAGYRCPMCAATQCYRWIAPVVGEVVRLQERARFTRFTCLACREEYNLYPAEPQAEVWPRWLWGLGSITAILASLCGFIGVMALGPGLPPWLAALPAVVACGLGLVLIEARATRGRAVARGIVRRPGRAAA